MDKIAFPARIMRRFIETLLTDIGLEALSAALLKADLPEEWASPAYFNALDDMQTAQAYSRLQSALRAFYGRGARGILLRVGSKLWHYLLDDSAFGIKTQAVFIRGLPKSLRRKPALELLARNLGAAFGDITVHTLDLDLLVVDQASPTTLEQADNAPICFVTLGLIRECLYWADGQEHDIEERACRASGARQCEFRITLET
jgi:predicted hydrocarbon binding protein